MAEFENCIGETDEWYTPPELLEALNEEYDLDPCSPGNTHWVKAKNTFTKEDDGLTKEWNGFVFMNPPFGGRNGHVPWLQKFIEHNNGIGIVRAYTSSKWFHEYIPKVDAVLFPKGKTQFIRQTGEIGKSPGHGIVIIAMGTRAKQALKNSNLGIYLEMPEQGPEK